MNEWKEKKIKKGKRKSFAILIINSYYFCGGSGGDVITLGNHGKGLFGVAECTVHSIEDVEL